MSHDKLSRRQVLAAAGLAPLLQSAISFGAEGTPLNGVAGIDRVTVLPGKTYLRGWAGYGDPPRPQRRGPGAPPTPPPAQALPATAATPPGARNPVRAQ